jgi:SAM-dependent methyltransferase
VRGFEAAAENSAYGLQKGGRMALWDRLRNFARRQVEPIFDQVRHEASVDYATLVATLYLGFIESRDLSGKTVLEIGPGADFGAQIICCDRVRFTVADQFLPVWDDSYHPKFYAALLEAWGPSKALERVVSQGSYRGVIETIPLSAENLCSLAPRTFDAVLSNAVLEHVVDLDACMRSLNRITADGGIHSHQIDLRDHADFDRPLEYLLADRQRSEKEIILRGHPRRSKMIEDAFRRCGFAITDTNVTATATPEYLANFMPRLARSHGPYRDTRETDVSILGARYWIRKIFDIPDEITEPDARR